MIPITRPELPPLEEYEALVAEVWQSRMLSNFGPFAQRLEGLTSNYLGLPTRVVVSGDVGLILMIAALRLPEGAHVVVPSFTFNSTINAVLWNGLKPVFADIDPETFNLDAASADEAASRYKAKLIIGTHVFGNPADVDGLTEVAKARDARLLFDAAHGYGSERDGRRVGTFGDGEVFSLSATKLVTTAEGGLVSAGDETLLARISYLRGYGFQGDYNSQFVGMNGKMSELHAALGVLTLARIEDAIASRHALVDEYRRRLGDGPIRYQLVRPQDRSTYKDFALVFESEEQRALAESCLLNAGAQSKRYFRPCHSQDAYRTFPAVNLTNTEAMYSRALCIPLFESIRPDEVDTVVEALESAIA